VSEGSMKGSGIYSVDETWDVDCSCDVETCKCDNSWEQDFQTDDWGNISQKVKCPKCEHSFEYERESSDEDGSDPDYLHDQMGEAD
jgi:hypothetical protein